MTNSRKGIEKHAVAFYKAVKKSEEESKAYAERITDRKAYSQKYTNDEQHEFRLRRGYLIHDIEVKKKALFMCIEWTLRERGQLDGDKKSGITSEDYPRDSE